MNMPAREGEGGPEPSSNASYPAESTGPRALGGDLNRLLEAMPAAVALLDPEKGFIYLNQRAVELYGVDYTGAGVDSHMARVNALRFDGTPYRLEETPAYVALRTGREVRNMEMSIRGTAGMQIPLLVSAAPLLDEDGKAVVALIVFEDISDRKRMEESLERAKLAESSERHRALVSATVESLYRMSADWSEMLQINSRGSLVGTELHNRNWLQEFVPEEDRPRLLAAIEEAVGTKSVLQIEHRTIGKYGPGGWRSNRAVPILGADGEIKEWLGLLRDISGRKEAEEALKAANARLEAEIAAIKQLQDIGARLVDFGDMRSIMDEILDAAISIVRADKGNIQFLDQDSGRLRIVAHRGLGPVFLKIFAVVHGGNKSCCTAVATGRQDVTEDLVRAFDGSPELPAILAEGVRSVVSTPLVSRSGKTLGALNVFHSALNRPNDLDLRLLDLLARQASDIIERTLAEQELKRYAEALKRSNAELQSFAYIASHDLREPLRMVSSYLDLLEKKYQSREVDPQAREYMRFAMDGAERMHEMINDLLTYSRIGTQGRPFAPVDMTEVVSIACKDLEAAIKECGASVTCGPLPSVSADQTQMLLLLENLVSNAVKFRSAEAPRVTVTARESGGEWTFLVQDNGIGIPEDQRDRLFHMFQRLHTRDEYPGTGIGLAIAKKIVERHGGRIWFESEVGKGSTVFFTIPAREGNGQTR